MIYDNLKKICSEKGVSVSRIESDLQFSRGSICKWNESKPSVDRVARVANYLGVDIETLVDPGDRKTG